MEDKKFTILYYVEGEIEVTGKDIKNVMQNFNNRVGFSNDDLYENLDHNFLIKNTTEKEDE